MYALLAAMVAISIYIWVRFEWQFGVGALFALFHDVSLTLGMFALFQFEFDLKIIAAILTIIGYSLNDTIVVYDRIRENLKKYRKMPLPELLDLSVNETLARTVMTSMTLLIALISLLLVRPGEPVRLHRGDHARHLRRHVQLDLHGRADPDLDGRDRRQLRAGRKPDRQAGTDRPRRGLDGDQARVDPVERFGVSRPAEPFDRGGDRFAVGRIGEDGLDPFGDRACGSRDTMRPATGLSTSSRAPPASVITSGQPQASASTQALASPSLAEGSTIASAADSTTGSSV